MAVKLITKYRKVDSTFADATSANNDKNSKYSSELLAEIQSWLDSKLEAGILLAPTVLSWDQATYTLTLERSVTSAEEINTNRPFSGNDILLAAEEAGWEFVSQETESV